MFQKGGSINAKMPLFKFDEGTNVDFWISGKEKGV